MKQINPQPFNRPLNTEIKGSFSSKFNLYRLGRYGQYLDRLHQIKFLGIGTKDGLLEDEAPEFHVGDVNSVSTDLGDMTANINNNPFTIDNEVLSQEVKKPVYVDTLLENGLKVLRQIDVLTEELFDSDRHILDAKVEQEVKAIKLAIGEVVDDYVADKMSEESGVDREVLFDPHRVELGDVLTEFIGNKLSYTPVEVAEVLASYSTIKWGIYYFVDTLADKIIYTAQEEKSYMLTKLHKAVILFDEAMNNVIKLFGSGELDIELLFNYFIDSGIVEDGAITFDKIKIGEIVKDTIARKLLNGLIEKDIPAKDVNILIGLYEICPLLSDDVPIERAIIENLTVGDVIRDVSLIEELTGIDVSDMSSFVDTLEYLGREFIKNANDVETHAPQIMAGKSPKPAILSFEHTLIAEDSIKYALIAKALYNDFVKFYMGDIEDDNSFIAHEKSKETVVPLQNYSVADTLRRDAQVTQEQTFGEKLGHESKVFSGDSIHGKKELRNSDENNTVIDDGLHGKDNIGREVDTMRGEHGELWNEEYTQVYDPPEMIQMELFSESEPLTPFEMPHVLGDLTSDSEPLPYDPVDYVLADLTSEDEPLYPDREEPLLGAITSSDTPLEYVPEIEYIADLANEPTDLPFVPEPEYLAFRSYDIDPKIEQEYKIAVYGCLKNDLSYRKRPDLEPDKKPEDPLWEWICTEGYVCEDWLIVPLKDFNFESSVDGFYDPDTLEPYFPTGQVDGNGDPYVLPPYSILNEPISNGVDVGGKEPMYINPCNLYSYIEYIVKIYDAYKSRFDASDPISTVSKVMNMLYEQTVKLVSEWTEDMWYTPDELWRIYRFIRWMALGITGRFYKVKLVYTYGDINEEFTRGITPEITTEGAVRRQVERFGWVLDGRPVAMGIDNKAHIKFKVPAKTKDSSITFILGNFVPERPDEEREGGIIFEEDFNGSNPKISGSGWIIGDRQSGKVLTVEDPAMRKTYKTSKFNIPENAVNPTISFQYGIDTNMETRLSLIRGGGSVVWVSSGNTVLSGGRIENTASGDYYFEVTVPQTESDKLTPLTFTATQIMDEWLKTGYQTNWTVDGNMIYEDENTPEMAMVVNTQWVEDTEYTIEVEVMTQDYPDEYGLIDYIGIVLNYKDDNNFYLFGFWSKFDTTDHAGLAKITGGADSAHNDVSNPTWRTHKDIHFEPGKWYKIKAIVIGNNFGLYINNQLYLTVTDPQGWGHGACGLAAYSNPYSTFRNFKYYSKPRFDCYLDNVKVECDKILVPAEKPQYAIDFTLDGEERVSDYTRENTRSYTFPLDYGEHSGSWIFSKTNSNRTVAQDASFVDSILVKGVKPVSVEVVEEFVDCGGRLAVKLLIENLLEYYRRHHQGCKGERNIWIIE